MKGDWTEIDVGKTLSLMKPPIQNENQKHYRMKPATMNLGRGVGGRCRDAEDPEDRLAKEYVVVENQ